MHHGDNEKIGARKAAWRFLPVVAGLAVLASWGWIEAPDITLAVSDTETASGQEAIGVQVFIQRFYPNPPGSTEMDEWIELVNNGAAAVDLSGWQLDDESGGSSPYLLHGISLASGEARRFERVATGIILNNGGDEVRLLSPAGEATQQVAYTQAPEGKIALVQDGQVSWQENIMDGSGASQDDAGAEQNGADGDGQDGGADSDTGGDNSGSGSDETAAASGPDTTAINLSEILANPIGSDSEGEFIELYNSGGPQSLTGWSLEVASTKTYHYDLTGEIVVGQYLVVGRAVSSLTLNNTSATVRLLYLDTVLSEFTYDDTKEGCSWAWIGGAWQEGEPTPGAPNIPWTQPQPITGNGGSSSAGLFIANSILSGTNGLTKTNVPSNTTIKSPWAGLVFSELLIDPIGRDDLGEWVEIRNTSGSGISLSRLEIRVGQDSALSKQHHFLSGQLSPGERMVVKQPDLGQELPNNGDSVYLLSPNGETITWLRYPKSAKPGSSWALCENSLNGMDGGCDVKSAGSNTEVFTNRGGQQYQELFSWTSLPTPGVTNVWQVNLPPEVLLAATIAAYQGVPVQFDASPSFDPEGEKLQFSWDFADDSLPGKGALTSHVYLAPGKYPALVKVNDGKHEVRAEAIITVLPAPKLSGQLQIAELLPKPLGRLPAWVAISSLASVPVDLLGISLAADGEVVWQASASYFLLPGEEAVLTKNQAAMPVSSRLGAGIEPLSLPVPKPGKQVKLELKGPDQTVLDSVAYQDVPGNRALARVGQDWQWAFPPTPGLPNTDLQLAEIAAADQAGNILPPLISAAETEPLPAGAKVRVLAPIAVGPGILSKDTFYVAGSGLKIKTSAGQILPELEPGRLVELYGELKDSTGGRFLALATTPEALKVTSKQVAIRPIVLAPDQISNDYLNQLVTITGEVMETSGSTFFIEDQKVYIAPGTGIKKPPMRRGDHFQITGILTQGTDSLRLLPRIQADVIKIETEDAKGSGNVAGAAQAAQIANGSQISAPPVPSADAKTAVASQAAAGPARSFPWPIVFFSLFLLVIVTGTVRYLFNKS